MKKINQFKQSHANQLTKFLHAPQRPDGTMRYWECVGFLYVVACSPELIMPSDWLPVIFNSDGSDDAILDTTQEVLEALMALSNELNRQVQKSDVSLLPGCDMHDDPMANMKHDAPISQWSSGFMEGYHWLEELWNEYIPDELNEEAGHSMLVLSFFSSPKLAKAFTDDLTKDSVTFESMASDMQSMFIDAMQTFAHLGLSIQHAIRDLQSESNQPIRNEKIGRNEPCPCGSGKKYKKCCAVES